MNINAQAWLFAFVAVFGMAAMVIIFNSMEKDDMVGNSIRILGVGIIISLTIWIFMSFVMAFTTD